MSISKKLILSCIAFVSAILVTFIGLWIYFAQGLDISKITDINQTINIMDKDDVYVTGVYSKENRSKINIDELPEYTKNAFIAIEDERFYKHVGIDIKRIFGALISNIKSGGRNEGASTITQQLIKLSHLSSNKTYTRKIKEAFMSLELERRYSKDEIIEMYLNYCYFGNGAYGIDAAAKKYFGISAKNLSLSQSALLAGILKSPSNYAPHTNPDNSIKRRNLVLEQMKKNGYIDENECSYSKNEELSIVSVTEDTYPYGYYIDTVLYETEQLLGIASEDLLKEGYTIYTTMDVEIQKSLESSAKTDLPVSENGNPPEIAMVVLSPNGNINGIVGGREHTARRGINRAMDIRRSPGSTIKPVLVYAPAYEYNGFDNTTFILDEKQSFNEYSPSNAGDKYYGWVTVKEAMAKSLNIPAVKVLNQIGLNNAKTYCQSVGIDFEDSDNHLALALGGFTNGITPLKMTASYLPFANGGYYLPPSCIRKIEDKEGNIIYENTQQKQQVLSSETAFLITNCLQETVKNGTANKLSDLNLPIASKTGTSNIQNTGSNKDAWIISYTSDYICGIWIGNDDGSPLPKGISGSTYPADMTKKIFKDIYKFSSPHDFVKPDTISLVRLDKATLEQNKEAVLASPYAPDSTVLYEYFINYKIPAKQSTNYSKLNDIKDFNVTVDDTGKPTISFLSEHENINYTIMRIGNSGQQPIYQTSGQNKAISFTDDSAISGEKYMYYVIAMLGDISVETKKFEIKLEKVDNEKTEEKTSSVPPTQSTSTKTTENSDNKTENTSEFSP